MATTVPYDEMTVVPRMAIELPLALPTPPGFDPMRLETWPAIPGRLEYVGGRLLYMPPCGDDQQQTAIDLAAELSAWQRRSVGFVVGGNEAGMALGGEVRAAEAAVWRRASLPANTGGFPRVAPVLAAEVAGKDDTVDLLREKAAWYLAHGVEVVWILLPRERRALVITTAGEQSVAAGGRLPPHPALPGLAPEVDDLFRQVSGR